jgi:hypothetical protein
MISEWRAPRRIDAHRLLHGTQPFGLPGSMTAPRAELPSKSVEQVFRTGLLQDVVLGPDGEVNTRLDRFFDGFSALSAFTGAVGLREWGDFAVEANCRRSAAEAFLGQSLQDARAFLASAPGRFLVRVLPFENRERRNDTHELLYFRDSGVHRRLIERMKRPGFSGGGLV